LELPVTVWQDFSILFELREKSFKLMETQVVFLADLGKLVNLIVHPDYMDDSSSTIYRDFLVFLNKAFNFYFTTPQCLIEESRKSLL